MRISFLGAAREVTGSCHLLEAGELRILLDCGLIQGGSERIQRNQAPFPFDPGSIDFVILSHAHMDHSGRLPALVGQRYKGPIIISAASRALSGILLPDAGRIQEEEARWRIRRLEKKGRDSSKIRPLFTEEQANRALTRFESIPFRKSLPLNEKVCVRFIEAGHILGASIVELEVKEAGGSRTVALSGDLGVPGSRLLGRPESISVPDYLLIESTYGDRVRDPYEDPTEDLRRIVSSTLEGGGKVIIPAFAVGRTQEILARLNDLIESKKLEQCRVYVDSPMAVAATKVFAVHPEAYSEAARKGLNAGDEPLDFPGLRLVTSIEDSIELNHSKEPCVIISASGMCDAGRIKHHLKHNIASSRNTVLFVGHQAQRSLGKVIQSGANPVRIFGEYYPAKARIESIEGLSAQADLNGLLEWFQALGGLPRRTLVVHGDEKAATTFSALLRSRFGASSVAPRLGEVFELE